MVECPSRSGALITANLAADYGKHVFAIPGGIDRPGSEGCNELIRTGATLVTNGSQLLDELSPVPPEASSTAPLHKSSPHPDSPHLSEDEDRVLAQLSGEECTMDQIIEGSDLPASTVAATLLRLEMKCLARQLPGPYFVKSC